jgi:hypothetical protein
LYWRAGTVIFPDSTLAVVRTRVKPLAEGVVAVHALLRLTGQTAGRAVRQSGARRTVFSFVMRHAAGGWRCAAAHNTDVVPGAETQVRDETGALRAADYRRAGK